MNGDHLVRSAEVTQSAPVDVSADAGLGVSQTVEPQRRSSAYMRAMRLRQFFLAVVATFIAIGLYFACFAVGFIDWSVFVIGSSAALACVLLFFVLFYTELNLHLADPSLILPQSVCAITITAYVMAYAGPARPALGLLFFAILVFAAFRFNWRVFLFLAILVLGCHAASIYLAQRVDARPINLHAEMIQWLCMAIMMPWLGWMASALGAQRKQFKAGAALYRAIWNTSVDAVVIFDQTGAIRLANPAALRLFGYDAAALRAMQVTQLSPQHKRAALERDLAQYLGQGTMARNWSAFEDSVVRADGREVFVEAAVVELGGAGGRRDLFEDGGRRLALFARDVSQRHAMEAIKDDFIASMSHELRTPLAAVVGAVEAMQAEPVDSVPAHARALLDMAASGADRLNSLINTMLNLQRIDSGKIEFVPAVMLASDLVDKAFESESPAVRNRGLFLAVARRAEKVRIRADARWMHEVLLNLIDNAVKHSPPGATVVIGAEARDSAVRFSVVDQGTGVSAEFAGRVFTRFARADVSNTRSQGGAGLGLSLCKAAVEGCGGTIGYFNNPVKGSTFWFELPRTDDHV